MLTILKKPEIEPSIEYRSYMPMSIPKNRDKLVKLITALNRNIILLQSEHQGKYFHRGKLLYDPNDPEVLQLEFTIPPKRTTIHLDDINGLMKEIY